MGSNKAVIKKQLKEQYNQQQNNQQIADYYNNKNRMYNYLLNGRGLLGKIGKNMMNSSNGLASKLGKGLYMGTGQKYLDAIGTKVHDFLGIGSKAPTANIAQNALTESASSQIPSAAQSVGTIGSNTLGGSTLGSSALGSSTVGAGTLGTSAELGGSALGSAIAAETGGSLGAGIGAGTAATGAGLGAGATGAGIGAGMSSAGAGLAGAMGGTAAGTAAAGTAAGAGTAAAAGGAGAMGAAGTMSAFGPIGIAAAAAMMIANALISKNKQDQEDKDKANQQMIKGATERKQNASQAISELQDRSKQQLENGMQVMQNDGNSELKNEILRQIGINTPEQSQTLNNELPVASVTPAAPVTQTPQSNILGDTAMSALGTVANGVVDNIGNSTASNVASNAAEEIPVSYEIPDEPVDLKGSVTQESTIPADTSIQQNVDIDVSGTGNDVADTANTDTKQSKITEILKQFQDGYKDNSQNSFDAKNLTPDKNKTGWNRLGEAIGTGQRFISNPFVQGAIAGTLYGIDEKDALYGLGKGVEWATNKANQNYYARKMGEQPAVFGGLNDKDYSAENDKQYQDSRIDISTKDLKRKADKDANDEFWENMKYNQKEKQFRAQNYMTASEQLEALLSTGQISQDDYKKITESPTFDPNKEININAVKTTNEITKTNNDTAKTTAYVANTNDMIGDRKIKNDILYKNLELKQKELAEKIRHNTATEAEIREYHNNYIALKRYQIEHRGSKKSLSSNDMFVNSLEADIDKGLTRISGEKAREDLGYTDDNGNFVYDVGVSNYKGQIANKEANLKKQKTVLKGAKKRGFFYVKAPGSGQRAVIPYDDIQQAIEEGGEIIWE